MNELNDTVSTSSEKDMSNENAAFVCPVDPAELAQCDSCQ